MLGLKPSQPIAKKLEKLDPNNLEDHAAIDELITKNVKNINPTKVIEFGQYLDEVKNAQQIPDGVDLLWRLGWLQRHATTLGSGNLIRIGQRTRHLRGPALAATAAEVIARHRGAVRMPDAQEALGMEAFGDLHAFELAHRVIAVAPDTVKFLAGTGSDPLPGNSKMLRELLLAETKAWEGYVRLAKIEPQ